jgi:pilus assembly protein Flp/PilA
MWEHSIERQEGAVKTKGRVPSALKLNQKGATAIEYALIVGLMAALLIGVFTGFGDKLSGLFTAINNKIQTATESIQNTNPAQTGQ